MVLVDPQASGQHNPPALGQARFFMNIDSVYSDLTLKNGAKMALLVMDGLGDIATAATDYKTPLEAAVAISPRPSITSRAILAPFFRVRSE